jgi:hypothetical protein
LGNGIPEGGKESESAEGFAVLRRMEIFFRQKIPGKNEGKNEPAQPSIP